VRKTTIALADDHQVVRQGLRVLLEAEPDFSVVGEAGDGLAAIRLVESLNPNILLLDLMMPGLNGQEVIGTVRKRQPRTRTIVLSMHSSEPYVLEALKNGAAGYVLKDASCADLIRAVREVTAGRRFLSPPLSERAIDAYQEKARASVADAYDLLTRREREVLQLTAEGHTNNAIGTRLSISPRTVETHRTNVMHKLGLRSHTELIKYSIARRIIPLDKS
jgi:DNA-binding NarL/FixJ family response regulator